MTERIFKIFVDFDGTITKVDVGATLFEHFGDKVGVKQIIDDWISEKITSTECWIRLCDSLPQVKKELLNEFVDSIPVDETYNYFVDYCRQNNFEIIVLSDGLDFYIDRIMNNKNIATKYYSNKVFFTPENKLVPSFPHTDSECKRCANCKRNHVINNSGDDEYTVYIGNGHSDFCPAQYCDYIFAKDSLLKFCERERISFFPYKNFFDVIDRLDDLKKIKRLKKRHQAELKRKEVYLRG